jgi:hypothetical protein
MPTREDLGAGVPPMAIPTGLDAAGWTRFGLFATMALVAAVRSWMHMPGRRADRCVHVDAPLGFHWYLLVWTTVCAVSSALLVLPFDTELENMALDVIANCCALTVS